MKSIECDEYFYWFRQLDNEGVIRDILWAHPDSIKLLNSFSIVLIRDTIYKTNKYCLPLLEVVGITSTNITFDVAFAYLNSERTDNLPVKDDVLP